MSKKQKLINQHQRAQRSLRGDFQTQMMKLDEQENCAIN
jgi:hypothetical protein